MKKKIEVPRLFKLLCLFLFFSLSISAQSIVKGRISDENGLALSNVTISIRGTSIGTQSNEQGLYSLKVPSDSGFVLQFSSLERQAKTHRLKLRKGESKTLDEQLQKSTIDLNAVIIEDRSDRNSGITRIDPKSIENLPNASGNFEGILKTLPGVSSNNEMSSQYSVRGGNYDENLVYVNDIEIYRPQLIRSGQQEGLSFINPDLVSGIRFSSGGFEARYGDKLSSALDITYKKPKKAALNASTGLLANSLSFEGSSKAHRFRYLFGARQKTNRSLLRGQDTKGEYTPFFADVQSYFSFDLTDKWELSLLSSYNYNRFNLVPQDRQTNFGTFGQALQLNVDFEGQEIDRFSTLMSGLTANYRPNNHFQSKFIVSAFDIDESELFDVEGAYIFSEVESDFGKANFGKIKAYRGIGSYFNHARNYLHSTIYNAEHKGIYSSKKQTLYWGAKIQYENTRDQLKEWTLIDSGGYSVPDADGKLLLNSLIRSNNQIESQRYSAYLQDEISLSDSGHVFLTLGSRINYWDFNKEVIVSPRASLSIIPRHWKKDVLFRLASGVYNQPPFFREMRDLNGKINTHIKAQKSIHLVAAADYNFRMLGNRPFKFTTELYYKHLYDLIPYEVDNVRIRYYANNNASGYATGIDFRLNGEFVDGLESWFSLSLLKTMEDIKGDSYYTADSVKVSPGYIPRPTDQRVNFSIFFQDKLLKSPTNKVHLALQYGSGLPTGPPDFNRYKDTLRIPSYRRVDIGFSKDFITAERRAKTGILKNCKSLALYIEVLNLLQVKNTISFLWIRDVDNVQYAIPNYLTARQFNLRLVARF